MPHSSTVSFLSYWRGLQTRPDKAPARDRFDPARLKSLIPQMIMISTSDAAYRFRLSGGFLVAVHGYELKDTSFLSLFRSPFLDTVKTALQGSLHREQPLILTVSAPWLTEDDSGTPYQNETVSLEICLCPMMNLQGQVDRFVGVYQTLSVAPKNTRVVWAAIPWCQRGCMSRTGRSRPRICAWFPSRAAE
ncbi:sensory box protein [Asticcacaulis biprosthecium C19]|uniref:Sensory box protein n=1 Tax=Asticcacaulis biprosthecium C19 TaxID=715226 RepID=F4QS95_9CAUL|nr:PAS domain-containing protein [Asticcacaulis biprosthecium]EGF89615.1 sensory box protein [Asticcacaulis biprosthecium C19]